MSEPPYIPFYRPYGMSEEEYEYEVKLAERKYAQWEAEQQEQGEVPE